MPPLRIGAATEGIIMCACSQNDRRHTYPRFQGDALQANLALVDRVKELAAKKGVTPGQLALAWVHAQVRPRMLACSITCKQPRGMHA